MLGGFEGGGFDLFILMIPGCIFFCLSVGWWEMRMGFCRTRILESLDGIAKLLHS